MGRPGGEQKRVAGVRLGLAQGHHGRQPLQLRRGRGADLCWIAENLLKDTVAAAVTGTAAGLRGPLHHVVAIGKRGHNGIVLRARGFAVDQRIAVDPRAVGIEHHGEDVLTGADRRILVPGDDKPASIERNDIGVVAVACDVFVDAHLAANGRAGAVVALVVNTVGIGAVLGVGTPGDDKVAIVQCRDGRLILLAVRKGVDLELTTFGQAVRAENARRDGAGRPVTVGHVTLGPHHDEPTRIECRDGAVGLIADGLSVDQEFASHSGAGGVEKLALHGVRTAIAPGEVVGGPCDDIAAVRQAHDIGIGLGVCGIGRNDLFRDGAVSACVIAIQLDRRAIVVAPDNHPAAVAQPGHLRLELRRRDRGVDLEFATDRHAVRIVALCKDPAVVVAGIVLIDRFPDGNIAAIGQRRDRAVVLIAGRKGVDLHFAAHRAVTVSLRRDVDDNPGGLDRAAVTILEREAQSGLVTRVVRQVLIGEILDQHLNQGHGRIRVEGDLERRASGAVAGDGADVRAVHGHIRSADGHRARGIQPKLILGIGILWQVVILEFRPSNHRKLQSAAIEIGGIRVRQGHRAVGIDPLGCGIHRVLVEAVCCAERAELRVGTGLAEGRRIAQQAPEDTRTAAIASRAGGVRLPDGKDIARGQTDQIGQRLIARDLLIDDLFAGGRNAACIEAACRNAVAGAIPRSSGGKCRPADRESAIGGGRHRRLVLRARKFDIDLLFCAHSRAVALEDLREDALSRPIGAALIRPNHDKPTAIQAGDNRFALGARYCGICHELSADRCAEGVVDLCMDVAGILPGDHEPPGGQTIGIRAGRDRRSRGGRLLRTRIPAGGVHRKDPAGWRARSVIDPGPDILDVEVAAIVVVVPCHHIAAARKPGHIRVDLTARLDVACQLRRADRSCIGIERLHVHPVAAGIRPLIGNDEPAPVERGDARIELVACAGRADHEFVAGGGALSTEQLRDHRKAAAVLRV